MIDFFERLDKFMIFKGLNDNKVTIETGISNGLIGKARKKGGGISLENISKILNTYPELNSEWLLKGVGEMIKNEKNIQQANNNIASTITQNQNSSSENSEIEALRRENTELKNKLIKLMEEKLGL